MAAFAALLSMFAAGAVAAVPVHIVKTDLKPLIRAGFDSPVQFAVLVPHAVSVASGGSWSTSAGRATWRYAVEVPTAVSLSFHATSSSLPDSAVLVVRGTQTTTSYRARDLHGGELWSRIQPGAALQFALTVPAADRARVAFSIVSLQAGYRSLGPGVHDHPYYRELKAQQAAAASNAACVTNYACKVSPSNTPPGSATLGLVVGNLYQCTGSLINDVPGDNTPYILTARHCETGHLGGGLPGAASTVTVYWDAMTACGATLGSIYDAGVPIQTGARTIVEQQDAWLIELDDLPVVSDAQLAGFDASGGSVQGGYTIHHAEGYDKQFTGWFGQAAVLQQSAVLGVSYVSDFLETVNATGNIGPGASGSGLFDQYDHLVGLLSLGRTSNDASGYGSCPVANPPQPTGGNGVADFTGLAAVWNSTADATSTTGSATLRSVLDPNNSGVTVVPSAPVAVVSFGATEDTVIFGQPVRLMWNAVNATQCSASDGIAGDGWTGTLPASGTRLVTEAGAGVVTYTLSCVYPGGRSSKASTRITWASPAPQLQFAASTVSAWVGSAVNLTWTSNVAPCSISGGVSLGNLPSSGTTTISAPAAGEVLYTLTCGPANGSGSMPALVQWLTPNLVFNANGTDRLLGAAFSLQWVTAPNTQCTPAGGAPNDGWASTAFPAGSAQEFAPQVTTPGTYTYSLTCSAGALSLQRSVTVTFEDNAPYASAALGSPSVTFSDSPADYVTLTYNSNLSSCNLSSTPSINTNSAAVGSGPQGVLTLAPSASGTYQLSLQCTAFIAGATTTASTTNMTLTVLPPPSPTATLSFNPGTAVVAGQSFTVAWSSTDAEACTASGGIPGGAWALSVGAEQPPAGSVAEIAQPGQFTFGLTCQSVDPSVGSVVTQATLDISAPAPSVAASPASATSGGGHGGGGAIGVLELALLGVLGALRCAARVPVAAGRRRAA